MSNTKAYAAYHKSEALKPFAFDRRELRDNDVQIDIDYCGVCHSDIHMVNDDFDNAVYPVVPGHEIIGRVKAVGSAVDGFKVGDLVGVGCMVGSCQKCDSCKEGLEQYCEKGMVMTYGSPDPYTPDMMTYGGYSSQIVVPENFVLHVSETLDAKAVAPLLCAGITTYSPLRYWGVQAGWKVGVVGLGGLGHMGVKLAVAMGAHVVMITTSPDKAADAKRLGAAEVLISKDAEAMAAQAGTFDFILNTVPVKHDLTPYIPLLKRDKTMALVGISPVMMHGLPLALGRNVIASSMIGGIAETQEMLDFCAEHNVVSEVEMIDIQDINQAYARVQKSDVRYRFVIDMKSLDNA